MTGPTIVQSVGAFTYIGCYTDNSGSSATRTLNGSIMLDQPNESVETCAMNCADYAYFGVEWAQVRCGHTQFCLFTTLLPALGTALGSGILSNGVFFFIQARAYLPALTAK